MKVIFIFVDGLGVGQKNKLHNPCALPGLKLFNFFLSDLFPKKLPNGGLAQAIDCQMDIPGLPQSATGQTALFTGKNAAHILGKHLSGFPNQKLRDLLTEVSILKKITQIGKKAAFINAYRPIFFERGPQTLIRFLSVTSIMNWKAGLKFFDFDDLRAEKCIYHDFTNQELIRKEFAVPQFTAEKAGQILARASRDYDFLLYEYFKTDHAGHKQDISAAGDLLFELEKFIFSVLSNIDLRETLLLVTSDHGNIEDLSIKTHTTNPVPLMVWGNKKKKFINSIESIIDVTSRLIQLF